MYDITRVGDIPSPTPFQCLHYHHHVCLTDSKNYGLRKGEGGSCPNQCFIC